MISSQYAETGFIWEVYDDATGVGIDNHPFTGWSALYTNLLSEKY
jgi:mannosyl-oligosaccharide glucosidase